MSENGSATQHWVVGNEVVFKTVSGEDVVATVFAHDSTTGVLLFKEAGMHNGVANLRYLHSEQVAKVISSTLPATPFDMTLPPVDSARCQQREERAVKQAEAEAAKIGKGVSRQSQAIFDALSKTLPCVWKGTDIVVLDEIVIKDPYLPASCSSQRAHDATLQRVQLVLKAERVRLGLPADTA